MKKAKIVAQIVDELRKTHEYFIHEVQESGKKTYLIVTKNPTGPGKPMMTRLREEYSKGRDTNGIEGN